MKLLIVEDGPEFVEEIRELVNDLELDVVVAENAEQAYAAIANQDFDMAVCDLVIPASWTAREAHKEHGFGVVDRLRVAMPGVPVVIYSAFGELKDLQDRLARAPSHDICGESATPMVTHRAKSQLVKVADEIRSYFEGLAALERMEISPAIVRTSLNALDRRILRIHARRYGGQLVRATRLASGRSGAATLLVEVEREDGSLASRVVAKLNDLGSLEDEDEHYDLFVAPLLAATVFTPRIPASVRAGAGRRGGTLYSLAQGFDAALFEALRTDPGSGAAIVAWLREALQPWERAAAGRAVKVRDIRRTLLPDNRIPNLRAPVPWLTAELEGQTVLVRWGPTHGDLHGGNVLINGSGNAVVIDFGRVGRAPTAVDPITLELSMALHPDSAFAGAGWPTIDQASNWHDLNKYLVHCPVAEFVEACRNWARDVSRGDREMDAIVYAYGLRQLLYSDSSLVLAEAFSAGAAGRIGTAAA